MRTSFITISILFLASSAMGQVAPDWWEDPDYLVVNGDPRNDSAIATIGQAKHVVKQSYKYLVDQLGSVGVGSEVQFIYDTYCVNPPVDDSDNSPITLGQLKYLTKPFYDRLNSSEVGFDTTNLNELDADGIYPWTEEQQDDADSSLATIGQLKFCFSFDLSDHVLPALDWDAYRTNLVNHFNDDLYDSIDDIAQDDDFDGDGVTNFDEFNAGTPSNVFFENIAPHIQLTNNVDFVARPGGFLVNALQVSLEDASGAPLPGKPVHIEVESGNGGVGILDGGAVTSSVTIWTDSSGNAWVEYKSGAWGDVSNLRVYIGDDSVLDHDYYTVRALGYAGLSVEAGADYGLLNVFDDMPYAWGRNDYGQVGNNTNSKIINPPEKLASVIDGEGSSVVLESISAGGRHTVAHATNGDYYAWGANDFGQLGNGGSTSIRTPIRIAMPWVDREIVQLCAGEDHTLALLDDGTVWAWGLNTRGQLGQDPSANSFVNMPVQVANLSDCTMIAVGAHHSMALTGDGTVFGWGDNRSGQLGENSISTYEYAPVAIEMPEGYHARSIAAGRTHAIACLEDGSLAVWGANESGQLGLGDNVHRTEPVLISGLGAVTDAVCGGFSSFAILESGEVFAWGANWSNQLGVSGLSGNSNVPVLLPTDSIDVVAVSLGRDHGYYIDANGDAYSWGSNDYQQLGQEGVDPIILSYVNN